MKRKFFVILAVLVLVHCLSACSDNSIDDADVLTEESSELFEDEGVFEEQAVVTLFANGGTIWFGAEEPYDAELDPVMYTMELKSFEDLEMEGLSYYIHALDLGWHISPVGNQDNHSADWGTYNDVRTGVVVKQLTKADFYDAYRNHRTYYTCAKNLRLAYQTNGYMMGSIIPKAEQYR